MLKLKNETLNFVTCFPTVKEMGYYINRNNAINAILFSVVNSVTSLSGTFLNSTFIITVLKNKSLQTIPNVILIGLALNDLFMATAVMPMTVYIAANLATGKVFCTVYLVNVFLIHSSMSISYVLIVAISVEKCLAATHPFWYDLHLSTTKVIVVTIGLPTGVVLTTVTWLALGEIAIYNIAQSIIIFIAYTVFLFCQIRVFMVVRKIKRRIDREQTAARDGDDLVKSKRKARSLLYIVLSFMLCYLPITVNAFHTYVNGHNQIVYQYVLPWLQTLAFLSPTLSPVVYYWRLSDVRRAARKLFSRSRVDVGDLPT